MEKKTISIIQSDIIFKALYYTARNEGVEVTEELTEIYEVLADHNPKDTHVTDTVEVMEYLSEFIKNSNDYKEFFLKEDDCDNLEE